MGEKFFDPPILLPPTSHYLQNYFAGSVIHHVRLSGGDLCIAFPPLTWKTLNSICFRIKPIRIHQYFICINTIIITNTVICTFNIRLFNLAKTILIWAKKCLNEAVLFENAVLWKYTWNRQTLPTSKFRWLRCCHPIPGALAAQSIAKLSWQG